MSEHLENPGSASSHRPLPGVPLPGPRRSVSIGSETVINPERRAAPGGGERDLVSTASSGLLAIMFPTPNSGAEGVGRDPLGIELGHFRIEERIRTGGMGAVFKALDLRLKRIVALKVLPPSQSRDFSSVQRFRNEAQAAAQLDHENIARAFYIGEDQGLHFIAFEFITGINLRDVIEQQGRLEPADAVNYTLQVASALVHTSAQGVVHRDVKPSNIIITPSGRAKLVDLGLARSEHLEPGAELTLAGTTLGTFDYISPEQAKDPRSVDVRSDIYSLGCTLYHMLTGEPPYPEGTVLQKLLDHQGKDVPDPKLKNRQVSDDLSAIVRKMMASDPRRRYQSAEQLIRDLMLIAGSMGLRSISSEGLIWMSAQAPRAPFWERHVGWLATVTALFVIVGYLKYNPDPLPRASGAGLATSRTTPPPLPDELPDVADDFRPLPTHAARGTPGGNLPAVSNAAPVQTVSGALTPSPPATFTPMTRSVTDSDPSVVFGPRPDGFNPRLDGGLMYGLPDDRVGGAPKPSDPDKFLSEIRTFLPSRSLPADLFPPPLKGGNEDGVASAARAAREDEAASGRPGSVPPIKTSERPSSEPPMKTLPLVVNDGGASPSVAAEVQPAISIVGADGTPGASFPTLEAACSDAVDGNVIELRFNGLRREKPLRINNKKITIRAVKGYRPLVEFVPVEVPSEGYLTRMITITSGSLDLVDVNLFLSVRDGISTDQWALFSVQRPEYIRVKGGVISVRNPLRRAAVIAEFKAGPSRGVLDMEMDTSQLLRRPPEIEFSDSLLRGECELFFVKQAEGARFTLRDCIVALDGTLLHAQGSMELPVDNAQWELTLDHVTAVLNGGLVEMESGDMPRKLIPLQITATNNIFSTTASGPASEPLVSTSGPAPAEDLRRLLIWNGQKNCYDRFQGFWTISSTAGMGKSGTLDFADWRRHWGLSSEVDPHAGIVIWQTQWSLKPFWELTPTDFSLDRTASGNPAISGANNGADVGANLGDLKRLNVLPLPIHE